MADCEWCAGMRGSDCDCAELAARDAARTDEQRALDNDAMANYVSEHENDCDKP